MKDLSDNQKTFFSTRYLIISIQDVCKLKCDHASSSVEFIKLFHWFV
jgi:hypothetical protein